MINDLTKRKFCILSEDRHRDEIIYIFNGTFYEAKQVAKELLLEMRNYDYTEDEYRESHNLVYVISMMDGDYSVSIFLPQQLPNSLFHKQGESK
jgi:hypothetical protein